MSLAIPDGHKAIRHTVYLAIRELATVLIQGGVNVREFIEISKSAFVDACDDLQGQQTKQSSHTFAAVKTGLSRHEVSRLRKKARPKDSDAGFFAPPPAGRLLEAWYTRPSLVEPSGRPKGLRTGSDSDSFAQLSREFFPDTDPALILQGLRESGHVSNSEPVRPLKRNFSYGVTSVQSDLAHLLHWGVYGLVKCLAHNRKCKNQGVWLQRVVHSDPLSADELESARIKIRNRATDFCIGIDDLLNAHHKLSQSQDSPNAMEPQRVAIGLYYFEEPD